MERIDFYKYECERLQEAIGGYINSSKKLIESLKATRQELQKYESDFYAREDVMQMLHQAINTYEEAGSVDLYLLVDAYSRTQ